MTSFKEKRREQKDMLKRLREMPGDQKHESVVNMIIDAMIPRIDGARAELEASGFVPGMAFPADLHLVDGMPDLVCLQDASLNSCPQLVSAAAFPLLALSVLLESTAFFGELALYFPEFVEVRWRNNDVRAPFSWSIGFCNSTEFYDEKTTELMYLVGQELNLLPRDPRYTNPYRKTTYFEEKEELELRSVVRSEEREPRFSDEL